MTGTEAIANAFAAKSLSAYDLDPYLDTTTEANQLYLLNHAVDEIGRFVEIFKPRVALTLVAGTQSYGLRSTSFAQRVVKVKRVYINGTLLQVCGNSEPLSFLELEERSPNWPSSTANTPRYAAVAGGNLILDPPPSAAIVAAGNSSVAAQVLPAKFVSAALGVEIDLDDELQFAVPVYMAILAAEPTVDSADALERLARLAPRWQAVAAEVRERNRMSLMPTRVNEVCEDVMYL